MADKKAVLAAEMAKSVAEIEALKLAKEAKLRAERYDDRLAEIKAIELK